MRQGWAACLTRGKEFGFARGGHGRPTWGRRRRGPHPKYLRPGFDGHGLGRFLGRLLERLLGLLIWHPVAGRRGRVVARGHRGWAVLFGGCHVARGVFQEAHIDVAGHLDDIQAFPRGY